MAEITIERVESRSNLLRGEITCSPELRRFFSGEDFLVEYNTDVSDVPESILTVPVLAHVCPVAWIENADVLAPKVDAQFEESLRHARDVLMQMYPTFVQGGELRYAESRDEEPVEEFEKSGLLFTRGVDSTFSYVRHRDENPALISVQGWELPDYDRERWQRMKDELEEFGAEHGVENHFVRSNMASFYNYGMLQAYCKPHVDGAWYSSIGHGIGLPGLCAPLAYAEGMSELTMAASYWEGTCLPWGSNPNIVENVGWAGTDCHHDGYEFTRQERLEVIGDYIREEESDLEFRTCSEVTYNCNDCEKCYRTAVGLLIAGLDPNDHGYSLDDESFDDIRRGFEEGEWRVEQDERLMWEDLQKHASRDVDCQSEAAEQFFDWLREAEFSEFVGRSPPSAKTRLVRTVYRNTPYWAFNVTYPLYRKIKKRRRLQQGVGENWVDWRMEAVTADGE